MILFCNCRCKSEPFRGLELRDFPLFSVLRRCVQPIFLPSCTMQKKSTLDESLGYESSGTPGTGASALGVLAACLVALGMYEYNIAGTRDICPTVKEFEAWL